MKNKFISDKLATKPIIDSAVNSETDWERIDAMHDDEIDFSDCAELTPDLFVNVVVRQGVSNLRNIVQSDTAPTPTKPIQSDTITEIIEFLSTSPSLQDILNYHVSERAQTRMQRLLALNEAGLLGQPGQLELDEIEKIEHIMIMLKVQAAQQQFATN
ncbi:MAG: hypothetical protein AAF639_25325 [Chloroflexota bacterium]